jgi:hypothetical protein
VLAYLHLLLIAAAFAALSEIDPLNLEHNAALSKEPVAIRLASALYPAPDDSPTLHDPTQTAVTVVLLDEEVLRQLEGTWPLSYRKQRQVLDAILGFDPVTKEYKTQPKALFIDLLYTRPHTEPTSSSDHPKDLFDGLPGKVGTHVYLAGLASSESHELCRGQASIPGQPSRTLVDEESLLSEIRKSPIVKGVTLIEWRGCNGLYPLHVNEKQRHADTPALAMYDDIVCENARTGRCDMGRFGKPMHIRWNAFPQPQTPAYEWGACDQDPLPRGRIKSVFRRAEVLFEEILETIAHGRQSAISRCPSVNIVPASSIHSLGETERLRLFKNAAVLVGTSVSGTGDVTNTAVHGQQPGVLLHAMGLANLLQFQAHYVREPSPALEISIFCATQFLVVTFIYWVPVYRWRRIWGACGLLFVCALVAHAAIEWGLPRAVLICIGAALVFLIDLTAMGRAVFAFAAVCLVSVLCIVWGYAPMNFTVAAIAAVILGEKTFDLVRESYDNDPSEARIKRFFDRLASTSRVRKLLESKAQAQGSSGSPNNALGDQA